MLINIHLNPAVSKNQDQEERFDTLISPSSTVATLLEIEKELGQNDIIGIDEAFPGELETRNKIKEYNGPRNLHTKYAKLRGKY